MITYYFKTYGCQANVADSQGIMKYLSEMGCSEVEQEAAADLVVVNTCAVRDKAEQKLFSYLGELAEIKKQKPFMKLGVIGCVASYKKQELYKRFDHVNFVYGAREEIPALLAYLTDLVVKLQTKKQLFMDDPSTPIKSGGQDRDIKKMVRDNGLELGVSNISSFSMKLAEGARRADVLTSPKEAVKSFINIMTGCNKACAYCIVPVTRGKEISYAMNDIVERAKHDISNGTKEITFVGQNVNSYIDPETGEKFPELLRRVAQIDGDFWVRFITPHPQDMTRDLFEVMAQYGPKLTAYVHFPVQSGSNRILQEMGRNHTIEYYLEQIGWLRDLMPHATISTDLIVGFPGETEEDYQATRALMEKVRYDLIYSFIYSPRKYTRALKMEDVCAPEIKTARLTALQARQIEICFERNSLHVGKIFKALVEKRLEHGKLLARTEGNVRVVFDGADDLINSFINLRIESTGPVNMNGVLVQI